MDMTPHFPIYLDYGATTPVDPRIVDAMIPWLREPKLIIDTVERHRPTVLFSTPVMYRNLLREGAPMRPAFRALRHFVAAGEKLPESLYDDWLELCGNNPSQYFHHRQR